MRNKTRKEHTIHWKELSITLNEEKLLSSYDLLGKTKRVGVNLFQHPFSPGEGPDKYISILIINKNIEWEIYLKEDGTWSLM